MMNKLKFLPMATIGFSSLFVMLCIILSGHNFEGGVVAVALGAIFLTITVISKKLREVTVLFYLSASLLFSGVLMIAESTCSLDVANSVVGKDASVVATVTGESEAYPSKFVYILKTKSVNGIETDVKLRLVSNTSVDIYAGDEITFTSKVYSVDSFDNNLKRYYMSEGIYLGSNIYNGDEDITVIKDGSGSLLCKLQCVRDEIKTRIYSVLPNENGAVAVAMLLGDKSGVSDETLDSFRGSGVYHLFAVSGLHLSIWVLGVYSFLEKLGASKRINSLLGIFTVVLFMALTGFTPSVTRAGIMLIVLLAGNFLKQTSHSLNSLGCSLFIILAVNPMAAVSLSLILSFAATIGIITMYQKIDTSINLRLLSIKSKVLRKPIKAILSVFFVSVSAGVFTLPVSAVMFGEICITGPVTNVIISYPATLMMVMAGGTAVLSSVPFGANLCGFLCGILSEYITSVSDFFSALPYSSFKTDSVFFGVFIILVVTALICCFIVFKNNITRIKAIIASLVCAGILCSGAHILYNHNLTEIKVMDVDDGICIIAGKGSEKAVIGCGASDSYAFEDISYEIYDKNPSLLIVPDNNEWNSALLSDLNKKFSFDRIISGERIEDCETLVEPHFKLNPWADSSIEFHKTQSITYAYCVFGSDDMLIIFDSADGADFSTHPGADILICSYYLPQNMNLSAFDSIIISSTNQIGEDMIKLYSSQNPDIYSTLGENDFTIEMRKGSDPKISYN